MSGSGGECQKVRTKSGRLRFAILPVVLLGFLVGYFTWFTFFEYPPHRYHLDFEGATPIGMAQEMPDGYFVKELFIPGEVADAWVAISATDNYELWVNRKKIAADSFYALNVTNIHDVTGHLRRGKNVIGVRVNLRELGGGPGLLLKGGYADLAGNEHLFVSDRTWVVSPSFPSQGQGDLHWSSRQFDHSGWEPVRTASNSAKFSIFPSDTPPYLVGRALTGYWMGHPAPSRRTVYFVASFSLGGPARDAFIGLTGVSSYDLNVNEFSVTTNVLYEQKLDIYNIAPLLHPGVNTIGIGIKSMDEVPALFVQGHIDDGRAVISLQNESIWRVTDAVARVTDLAEGDSLEWRSPVSFARYPYLPLGILSKSEKPIGFSLAACAGRFLAFSSVVGLAVLSMVSIWLLISFWHSRVRHCSICDSLCIDSLLHLPPLIFLIAVYLLKYDVRLDVSFPFNSDFIFVAIIILFVLRFMEFVKVSISLLRGGKSLETVRISMNWLFPVLVVSLMIVGFLIRLHDLDGKSLIHDEISMMQYTNGLLERGYPSRTNGPYVKAMTTYELVPFSIVVPALGAGFNDFGGRLHSVFWGTLQIGMIFLLGRQMFGRSAGLLAAAIQTFHPWVNYWSRNVFHPQMAQFWATLTVFFLFRAMASDFSKKRFVYPIALFFSLTYLSWEGTGFLLAALPVAILACKAPDLSWLRNKHVWASLGLILLVIFIQQSRRILYMDSFLMVNGKLAELSLPQPFFLEPMYDPYFYFHNFFLPENNLILTLVLIAGGLLVFNNKPLRYLYVIILVPILCLSNLLPIYAYRYCFYLESFMILAASGVVVTSFRHAAEWVGQEASIARFSTCLSLLALCALLFFGTNTLLLRLFRLSENPPEPPPQYREHIYETDYRSADQYVKANMQERDLIITARSYPFQYYAGIDGGINGNYSLTTLLRLTMFFDISDGGHPGLIDKFAGLPIITSLDELKEITARYDRVWYLSAPDGVFETENDVGTTSFVKERFKVVYETFNSKVYLWQK